MATKFKAQAINEEAKTVTTTLGNGLVVVARIDNIPEALHMALMLHGLKQKVGDASSSFSKDNDFSGAFRAMQTVVDNLESGIWNAKGGSGTADLVLAIAGLKKIETEDAQELVDALDDEQLKAVLAKPAIKAAILKIKAERAAKVADASDDDLGI